VIVAGGAAVASTRFRTDIQGLRAIAVVLVVADHAFEWPSGGFVGVDVFYVISGYLITSLLLRELDRTGAISLRAFYARRVRRIVPAAALVLVVTTVVALLVWYLPRAIQTVIDAGYAFFFVINWHLIAVGTDYLHAEEPVSPVQHYWSLAVEEQFYAFAPLVILLGFIVVRRSRAGLAILVGTALVASLAYAAHATMINADTAYFNTAARAWELLAGCFLAIVGSPTRLANLWRQVLAGTGIAMIVASAIIVSTSSSVPFPWVIPAVAGSVVVIWASADAGPRSLLGNPISLWLGDVSYSLYLWHFPVLVFAASLFGESIWVAWVCIPVMIGLAWLSRRYVEEPILQSRFLAGASHATNSRPLSGRDLVFGFAATGAILALSIAALRAPDSLTDAGAAAQRLGYSRPVPEAVTEPEEWGSISEEVAARRLGVQAALESSAYPPTVLREIDTLYYGWHFSADLWATPPGCLNDALRRTERPMICGDSDADVLVVGDSMALSYLEGIRLAIASSGLSVAGLGFAACPLFDVAASDNAQTPGFEEACAEARQQMLSYIREIEPSVLVLSAWEAGLENTGLALEDAAQAWGAGVARTLSELREVSKVVVLAPPPASVDPRECITRVTGPSQCVSTISQQWLAKSSEELAASRKFDNVEFVDTRLWFCADDRCPPFVDGDLLRWDRTHLTAEASRELGPLLKAAVLGESIGASG
jgi:peptidoglycan/LPS O-acetylase OafA/YrhL